MFLYSPFASLYTSFGVGNCYEIKEPFLYLLLQAVYTLYVKEFFSDCLPSNRLLNSINFNTTLIL